jgi:hypothetical protein
MIPLAFVTVFFLATGYFQVKFPRYLLPLYPMLFIFAAALFGSIVKGVQSAPAMASPVVPPERSEKQVSSKALLAPVDVSACEVSVELPRSDARPEDSSD